jgi:hypothetical protein
VERNRGNQAMRATQGYVEQPLDDGSADALDFGIRREAPLDGKWEDVSSDLLRKPQTQNHQAASPVSLGPLE